MKIMGKTIRMGALSCILAMTTSAISAFAEDKWDFKCGLTFKDNEVQLEFTAEAKATSNFQPTKYKLDKTTFEYSETIEADADKKFAVHGCAWKPVLTITLISHPQGRPPPALCFKRAQVVCQTKHTFSNSPGGGHFFTFQQAPIADLGQHSEAIFTQLKNQCEEKARSTFSIYFGGPVTRTVSVDCDSPEIQTEIKLDALFGKAEPDAIFGESETAINYNYAHSSFVSDITIESSAVDLTTQINNEAATAQYFEPSSLNYQESSGVAVSPYPYQYQYQYSDPIS